MKKIPTSDFNFLAPTKKLRVYFLLEAINDNEKISQRKLADQAGISNSVGNQYLKEFEEDDLILKKPINERDYDYRLTEKGNKKRRKLMVEYLRETFQLFSNGKQELSSVLRDYGEEYNWEKIIFYSAGEVTELLLHALEEIDLSLLAIVDDDETQQGREMFGYPIVSKDEIPNLNPDGILITTFQHREEIMTNLEEIELKDTEVVGF